MPRLTHNQRVGLVSRANYLYEHRWSLGYSEVRPFRLRSLATLTSLFAQGQGPTDYDCSASIIEMYYLVGAQDPGGYKFSGYGNTASMLGWLHHHYTEAHHALPGAIAIFNADRSPYYQHACMVIQSGNDPLLFSHGRPGVDRQPLSWIQHGFSGHTVFLDVAGLG